MTIHVTALRFCALSLAVSIMIGNISPTRAAPPQKPTQDIQLPQTPPLPETAPERKEKSPPSGQNKVAPAPRSAQPNDRVYQVACPALINGDVVGEILPPINDGAQCRSQSPLSLSAIGKDGPLKFSHRVTTNCAMAMALSQWSGEIKRAARSSFGDRLTVTEIGTGSDYQCRNVNGADTGRISEHAFANALDIMSFTFSDGTVTDLSSGWSGNEKEKKFWRAIHKASCELFMTVIGPDGDAQHQNNMHLDQGCHGKTCIARICQ